MDDLNPIRRLILNDSRDEAQRLLGLYLSAHPHDPTAWELLADLVETPQQKIDCYSRVVRIDPANQEAVVRLSALTASAGESSLIKMS